MYRKTMNWGVFIFILQMFYFTLLNENSERKLFFFQNVNDFITIDRSP